MTTVRHLSEVTFWPGSEVMLLMFNPHDPTDIILCVFTGVFGAFYCFRCKMFGYLCILLSCYSLRVTDGLLVCWLVGWLAGWLVGCLALY